MVTSPIHRVERAIGATSVEEARRAVSDQGVGDGVVEKDLLRFRAAERGSGRR